MFTVKPLGNEQLPLPTEIEDDKTPLLTAAHDQSYGTISAVQNMDVTTAEVYNTIPPRPPNGNDVVPYVRMHVYLLVVATCAYDEGWKLSRY